ncbi:MAG TPA: hypothetical protein VHF92_12875 [Geodermatophilus sp.]|nr:hypothetical protein [Geodermatophilus sp.]
MRGYERLELMPILARGNHAHPRIGGCFAEVAGVLAAHRWTDHPACIPRVLAHIARGVNDRTGPEARMALAPLIPWAIFPPRPPRDLTRDIAVIAGLVELIRDERQDDPEFAPLLQRLERPPRPRHVLDRMAWRRAAQHLVRARLRSISSMPAGPVRDARLRALLTTAIDAARAVEGLPPFPEPVDAPVTGIRLLPVTAQVAAVDEAFELRVEPLLDRWPHWIGDPWNERLREIGARPVIDGQDLPERAAGARRLSPV